MSKEKETEKIISDKLNSREFAFDEKAWAGMENLLDEQEKKRRVGFWWWFSASMFVAILAGAVWFITGTNEIDEKAIAYEQNTKDFQPNAKDFELKAKDSELKAKEIEQNTKDFESNAIEIEVNTNIFFENPIVSEEKTAETAADSAKTAEQPLLTDSASLAETAKNPLTAPGKETRNAWGILAGVGYWFPYQSTLGPTDTKGVIGFTGGIYYQRTFNKHIELGLSAVYSSRGALNYDKTITNSEFGFGIESDKTTIAPQTLHYLNIPLYLRFNITQRSHLLVGAAYYQLLATTSKVTRTTENSFGVIESNTEKQTGEHAGFRKNDIAAFIGYELTLFDRMNAGLQFSYGFYDNTLNVYHPDYSGGVDKNISLQLQLKYDLIRH